MIFITGDCHSELNKFNMESFPEQKEMGREDYVIICGDFGIIWDAKGESRYEKYWLNWLEDKSYTTLFVDGNHENFERLYEYPIKEWHGGLVHEIRPHVLHLMRGYVFDINGKSIFAFGGAASHDIDGGILEPDDPDLKRKQKLLDDDFIPYRINHISWWKEEMPNEDEKIRGLINLQKHGNKVDYIISHDCPASLLNMVFSGRAKPDELNRYFEDVQQTIAFKKWFFGHYHDDRQLIDKHILLYDQLVRVQ